jgi:esterase/lipase superfamily enzyme
VLELLARSTAERIVLVGHSMGTVIVMETVRQLAIRGSDHVLDRIQGVVLLAPDLDPELFAAEVRALAPRVLPIYVSVSARDRALRVSGLLRGQAERLGSLTDTTSMAALPGVVVIDVTDIQGSGDPLNHFAVATSPAMISFISGLDRVGTTMLRDEDRSVGSLHGHGRCGDGARRGQAPAAGAVGAPPPGQRWAAMAEADAATRPRMAKVAGSPTVAPSQPAAE